MPPGRWLRWGALLLLAGYLLFGHLGCHGDEDTEPFASLARAVWTIGQRR
jgi:hypothetical protein